MKLNESSLEDLYQSAVLAFPRTTKRQYATDTIRITKLEWTPYLGMKTLFIKGLAQNEGKEYNTIVLFRKVDYDRDDVKIIANDGSQYSFGPLSMVENDVNVRCNCPDFHWRFNYYNSLDKSLYGRQRTKYEGTLWQANPLEFPGMCKHLMKTTRALQQAGLFEKTLR